MQPRRSPPPEAEPDSSPCAHLGLILPHIGELGISAAPTLGDNRIVRTRPQMPGYPFRYGHPATWRNHANRFDEVFIGLAASRPARSRALAVRVVERLLERSWRLE